MQKIRFTLFVETNYLELENFILNKVEETFPELKPFRLSGKFADCFEFYNTDISYEKILEVSAVFYAIVFTLREDKITDGLWPTNQCRLINAERLDITKEFVS